MRGEKVKWTIFGTMAAVITAGIVYDAVVTSRAPVGARPEDGVDAAAPLDLSGYDRAPDVTFTSLDEQQLHLRDFEGKVVLLNFWATWCPTCIKDFPGMLKLAERFQGKVVVIALSNDEGKSPIYDFMERYKAEHNTDLKSPYLYIAWDKNKHITGDIFNTERFPETIVLSKDLRMVRKLIGDTPWEDKELVAYFKALTQN